MIHHPLRLAAFRRIMIAVVMMLLFSVPARGQTATVAGTVTGRDSGEPLRGVEVHLEGTSIGSVTSAAGAFRIERIPLGRYTIEARRLGYESMVQTVDLAAASEVTLTFVLAPATLEIQEIVIEQASLVAGPLAARDIPGSVHRISERTLEKFQYGDIHRVLRSIPGINLQEEDGYGLRPNIGMRGTGSERSSRISLMEDGVLIAPAPYAAPAAYFFPTVGRMEEIEVRKGSSQIKYGPFTTGGALNLLSRSIPTATTGYLKGMLGNDDNRTVHAWAGTGFRNGGFVVETFQNRADGFKHIDSGGNTGFDKKDYLLKGRLQTAPGAAIFQSISLKFTSTSEVSNETYLGLTGPDFYVDPDRRYVGSKLDVMRASHRQYTAGYVIRPVRWFELATTAYLNRFARNWYKLDRVQADAGSARISIASLLENPARHSEEFDVITGQTSNTDGRLGVKANNRRYLSRGLQTEGLLRFDAFGREQTLDIGLRFHYDEMDRFQWVDDYAMMGGTMMLVTPGIPGTDSNRIESARATAAYAQETLDFGGITLQPGLRFEHIVQRRRDYGKEDPERTGRSIRERSNTTDILIPGVGVSARLAPTMTLFAGVHRGFAPPGSREDTDPEESINYEFGTRIRKGVHAVDLTGFFNDFSNLLGSDLAASGGSGTADQFNGGEVNVGGIEFLATSNLGELTGWRFSIPVRVTYTWTKTRFMSAFKSAYQPWGAVSQGDQLPYVPEHQLSMGFGLEGTRFDIDATVSTVGNVRTRAGAGSIPSSEKIGAHTVIDLSGGYDLAPHVRMFATIRNVTDTVYIAARRPAGLRPGLPRTLLMGLSASF